MPKRNLLDLSTDILKERIEAAWSILRQEYKGSNPYRQKPVDPKERILTYSQFTPEQFQEARRAFGDEAVDNYISEMQKLVKRGHYA